MTTTVPRLELLAAGLLQPADVVVHWHDGTLPTDSAVVRAYPDAVVWHTVIAVDEQGDHVYLTFADRDPMTLGADDDVVAIAA